MGLGVEMNLTTRFMTEVKDMEFMPYTKTYFQYAKSKRTQKDSNTAHNNGVMNWIYRNFHLLDPNKNIYGTLVTTILNAVSLPILIPVGLLGDFTEKFAFEVKNLDVRYSADKHPLRMIPGSFVLGAGCFASALADLVKDTALAVLNLFGIAITFGATPRADLFKRNFSHYLGNAGDDLAMTIKLPFLAIADIGVNVLYVSGHQVVKTGKLIRDLYFKILDSTPIAKFYPDQATA